MTVSVNHGSCSTKPASQLRMTRAGRPCPMAVHHDQSTARQHQFSLFRQCLQHIALGRRPFFRHVVIAPHCN